MDDYNNSEVRNNYSNCSKNSNKKKSKKENKNFYELDSNTSLIYWEDELSIFENLELKKDENLPNQFLSNCENDRLLIINVKNNLLFIDINSFECVRKFNFILFI